MIPFRQRRLTGHKALVDGIPYDMPVNSKRSPAIMVGFSIDAKAARALLPGSEIHPLKLPGGRSVLLVTVIDYRETDIGQYIEYSIAIACTRGRRAWPPFVGVLFRRLCRTGQFVIDLPVSSEISVKGGKGIWGMPKHQANLDFEITDDAVTSTYDLDGQFCTKLEVDRKGMFGRLPMVASAVNYCAFRGLLVKSTIYFKGKCSVAFGRKASARFLLGDHPRVDPLRTLDVASRPMFTVFIHESEGVLDDHFESWMITDTEAPPSPPEGLESVIDLGLGESWLEPPEDR